MVNGFTTDAAAVVRLVQYLDGDIVIVLEIVREMDGRHFIRAEFAFDTMTIGQYRRALG